jgi:DNA-binding LacI/PurR family transcriptional regulator
VSATTTIKRFVYQQARDVVIDLIRQEKLKPGDRLPSERELARRLGLNHQTVRRGLAALVTENVIDRQVGAGTFVRTVPAALVANESADASGGASRGRVRNENLVGVLVLPKPGSFAVEMLNHLQAEARRRRLQLDIRVVEALDDSAMQQAVAMTDRDCGSLIVPMLPDRPVMAEITKLIASLPVSVTLAMSLPGLESCCYEVPDVFGTADYLAVEMVCSYLCGLGYGKIAFFGPDSRHTQLLKDRVFAYTQYMSQQGMGTYVGLAAIEAGDVDRIVKGWIPLAGDLAVICYDDDAAIRLMTSCHKHNLRIPEDIAVIGFNNSPMGMSADPPLSTVQFDYAYVAGAMLDHAVAHARGQLVQSRGGAREALVIRESCGGRRRAGANLPTIIERAQACWNRPEASSDAIA